MSAAVEGQAVNCPECGAQIGTTPDGKHLRAGKGSVLQGKAAALHTAGELIPTEAEGHGAMEVGCLSCPASFTVADVLNTGGRWERQLLASS